MARMNSEQRALAEAASLLWAAREDENGNMPTLYHALDIFAYHIGAIMSNTGGARVHFYGDVSGDYTFKKSDGGGHSDGDAAYVDGRCIGNRCSARNDYTERCAPVLAQIANYNNKDIGK